MTTQPKVTLTPSQVAELKQLIREAQEYTREACQAPGPAADDRPTLPCPPPSWALRREPRERRAAWMPPGDDSPTLPPKGWDQ